ncbi:MAG: amidohydrolase family protein [Ktedonobacteraceae bacterium]|nr:amidohydrolase family protein [Ktedonobacteraceae bacterium]
MLDLSGLPVVDNHCHPVLREQHMDVMQFRSYFSEATHPDFAQQHIPHTIYYLWLLHQLTALYWSERREDALIAARNRFTSDELLRKLIQSANIETLILDIAYPVPDRCYSSETMAEIGGCRVAKLLRLETLMEQLIMVFGDFDEVVERLASEVTNAREHGFCALKSIVAYRTGLMVSEWSKDKAARAFIEARAEATKTGKLRVTQKPLIDYLLHVAFARAAKQRLPIQFHTGYGDNDADLRLGNPLHLRAVLEKREYWDMPVVLLHESYPYTEPGAYLAAVYPHVYFDLSYTIPFVEKLEMLAFTRQALSVAPASKLLYSSDGIYVPEMHWAGAMRGRSVIGQALGEMIKIGEIDVQEGFALAKLILHDNACALYNL